MRKSGRIGMPSLRARRIVATALAAAALALGLIREPEGAGAPVSPPTALTFDSEIVRIAVLGDSVEIEGRYRFLTNHPGSGSVPLLYPFPADSRLGGARMVSVEGHARDTAWTSIPFSEVPDLPGALWRVPADGHDTLEVRAVYRQALRTTYARYIVTTTRSWGQPLRSARFEITLPAGASPHRFSHDFRAVRLRGRRVYVFEARQFLPDRDIEVEWSP